MLLSYFLLNYSELTKKYLLNYLDVTKINFSFAMSKQSIIANKTLTK